MPTHLHARRVVGGWVGGWVGNCCRTCLVRFYHLGNGSHFIFKRLCTPLRAVGWWNVAGTFEGGWVPWLPCLIQWYLASGCLDKQANTTP